MVASNCLRVVKASRVDLLSSPGAGMRRTVESLAGCDGVAYSTIVGDGIVLQYGSSEDCISGPRIDLERFATAMYVSLESALTLMKDRRKLPWAFISIYYAGFYAAHAILRSTGTSLIGFKDSERQLFIRQAKQLGATTYSPGGRNFLVQTKLNSNQNLVLESSDNSHEQIWKSLSQCFMAGLGTVSSGTLTSGALKSIREDVTKVASLPLRGFSGGSPSTTRNDINYRLSKSLWFPQGSTEPEIMRASCSSGWTGESSCLTSLPAAGEVDLEIRWLALVCRIAHSIVEELSSSPSDYGQSLSNGPGRFYQQHLKRLLP